MHRTDREQVMDLEEQVMDPEQVMDLLADLPRDIQASTFSCQQTDSVKSL